MTEQDKKEAKCIIRYDGDTKKKHRYLVESEEGIVGSIYVPRDMDPIPDVIVLEKHGSEKQEEKR